MVFSFLFFFLLCPFLLGCEPIRTCPRAGPLSVMGPNQPPVPQCLQAQDSSQGTDSRGEEERRSQREIMWNKERNAVRYGKKQMMGAYKELFTLKWGGHYGDP